MPWLNHGKTTQGRNMRRLHNLLALTLVPLVAGCSMFAARGSGKPATESRDVSGFTAVELAGSGKLDIEQTGTESLTVTADDNLLQYLVSEVQGGKLILRTQQGVSINPTVDVVYKLTVGKLNAISLAGSGTVDARRIATDSLKTSLAGSGDFTLSGQADEHEISVAGSGSVQGADLKSKSVKINIAGSGDVVVAASEKLDVDVAGAGSVEYIGDPVVSKRVLGSGSVKKH